MRKRVKRCRNKGGSTGRVGHAQCSLVVINQAITDKPNTSQTTANGKSSVLHCPFMRGIQFILLCLVLGIGALPNPGSAPTTGLTCTWATVNGADQGGDWSARLL